MARMMAKVCSVPGCKGQLQPGTIGGKPAEWCVACERRVRQLYAKCEEVAQLRAARAATPPAAAAPGDHGLSDAALLQLVAERLVSMKDAAQATKRAINVVQNAVVSGQLPYARIGRMWLLGKASVSTWSERWSRARGLLPSTKSYIENLPRTADDAIPLEEFARRTRKQLPAVTQWLGVHRENPRLRRRAALDERQRAVVLYWWQEEAPHA